MASRPPLRGFFALGTPASAAATPGGSGGPPADIDELAATLGRPRRDAGGGAVGVASTAPAAGLETEASSRPGTAASLDVVLADAARANPFTPPAVGPLSAWR